MSGSDENPFKRSRLSRLLDFFDGATRRAHRVSGTGVVGATEPYPEEMRLGNEVPRITARSRRRRLTDGGGRPVPVFSSDG